jgi:hypothetical protein
MNTKNERPDWPSAQTLTSERDPPPRPTNQHKRPNTKTAPTKKTTKNTTQVVRACARAREVKVSLSTRKYLDAFALMTKPSSRSLDPFALMMKASGFTVGAKPCAFAVKVCSREHDAHHAHDAHDE